MPAPVVDGLITYLATQLNVSVWDGEVPRYDALGNPIAPGTVSVPSSWPVVKLYMTEGGFNRTWAFEDSYDDVGEILISIWATSRKDLEDPTSGLLNKIETLLASASNWTHILLGGPQVNPYYVIQLLLINWCSVQEEGQRTSESQLMYRGDMHYELMVHGAVSTN